MLPNGRRAVPKAISGRGPPCEAPDCGACGQPLRPGEVEALPGPGARTGPGTAALARVLGGRSNTRGSLGSAIAGIGRIDRLAGGSPSAFDAWPPPPPEHVILYALILQSLSACRNSYSAFCALRSSYGLLDSSLRVQFSAAG